MTKQRNILIFLAMTLLSSCAPKVVSTKPILPERPLVKRVVVETCENDILCINGNSVDNALENWININEYTKKLEALLN